VKSTDKPLVWYIKDEEDLLRQAWDGVTIQNIFYMESTANAESISYVWENILA
jgi:hypothetical protein